MKLFAKLGSHIAAWIVERAMRGLKDATPEYAMSMRRRSKNRVIRQKYEATKTQSSADDIPPIAADYYLGFATMRQAQKMAGQILINCGNIIAQGHDDNPMRRQMLKEISDEARNILVTLDEQE